MTHIPRRTLLSAKIRKQTIRLQAAGLIVILIAQGISSVSLGDGNPSSENAAISIVINKDIQLQDSKNPRHSLGSLTPGSRVTLSIPASVASTLNGKTAISNEELSTLLSKIGGSSSAPSGGRRAPILQNIAINRAEQNSTVDMAVSAGSINLRDLLKSNAVSLQPVQYNVASIETGPGIPVIRDSTTHYVPPTPAMPPAALTPTAGVPAETSPGTPIAQPSTQPSTRPTARRADTIPAVRVAPALDAPAPRAQAESRPPALLTPTQANAPCVNCQIARAARLNQAQRTNVDQLRVVGQTARTQAARRAAIAESAEPVAAAPTGRGYSSSEAVRKMIASAMANRFSHSHQRCWHFVKAALYASGLVRRGSLNTEPARDAVGDLKRQGWKNLLATNPRLANSPGSVPVGAVIVYSCDFGKRLGHTEIRTANGYVSDYYRPTPAYGQHFHIIGVMVPGSY